MDRSDVNYAIVTAVSAGTRTRNWTSALLALEIHSEDFPPE
jgi:hypothetical protein